MKSAFAPIPKQTTYFLNSRVIRCILVEITGFASASNKLI